MLDLLGTFGRPDHSGNLHFVLIGLEHNQEQLICWVAVIGINMWNILCQQAIESTDVIRLWYGWLE